MKNEELQAALGVTESDLERYRQRDDRIRAALARGEKESLLSYTLRHPGSTLSSALFAIWPAGILGAAIGGGLALVLYLIFHINAQVLIPIGFIIAWGRSFWTYVSSSWFAALRMDEHV